MKAAILIALITHGVQVNINQGQCTCIQALYDDGSPFEEGEVKIYTPQEEEPVIEVITDENGVACFSLPGDEEWKVVVDDGMGHGEVLHIKREGGSTPLGHPSPPVLPRWAKALTGAGILWGLAGTIFYILAVRKLRNKNAHS